MKESRGKTTTRGGENRGNRKSARKERTGEASVVTKKKRNVFAERNYEKGA